MIRSRSPSASGTSPISGESIARRSPRSAGPTASTAHEIDFTVELGHPFFSDLQYACIFDLPFEMSVQRRR